MVVMRVLLMVILMVESGGKADALGDPRVEGGKTIYRARGAFQIWEIYWNDGCRIMKVNPTGEWDYKTGSFDVKKSAILVRAYLLHYGKRYKRLTGKEPSYEIYCRIHNGGPDGWRKKSTLKYWAKCRKVLDSMKTERVSK